MTVSYTVAITAATIYSAMSLYDAVHHGVTGEGSVFSDKYGTTWATITIGIVAAVSFIVNAAILVIERIRIDRGSRLRRWVRRLLAADLAVLAAVFGIGIPLMGALRPVSLDAAVGAVAGVAFASMFLLAVALGLCLVRVRQLRPSAVLLIAVLPALGLAIILQAIGSAFAHPAYAETAVYLGIALLGRRAEIDIAEPDPSGLPATLRSDCQGTNPDVAHCVGPSGMRDYVARMQERGRYHRDDDQQTGSLAIPCEHLQ